MRELGCYVGREWVRPKGSTIEVRNPATNGDVIARVAQLGVADVDRAVGVAAEVSPGWAARSPWQRAEVLRKAADLLENRAARVAKDLMEENGKPLSEAQGEVAKSIVTFRYYAGLAAALDGRAFEGGAPQLRHETRKEPLGPVAAVTPWNVPAAGPARKLAPALLAGNTVLLKPATATPITAIHLVECLYEAGADPGVVQLLCGSGPVVGQPLCCDPRVRAVSFTGSTAVGLQLKNALGRSMTRLQLELGGKNAALVFSDADLGTASSHILGAAFASAGQQCTATSRVLAQREIYQPLLELLATRARSFVVGDPFDQATQMGPLIDEAGIRRVEGFIRRAVKEGARIMTGGQRIPRPGYFFEPTILSHVHPGMEISREEVFGPVLSVMDFGSVEQSVELLNATPYGLSCAVHTRDIRTAQFVAKNADCGIVVVNGPTAGIELPAPFGGFKLSGTGWKEHGPESLEFYTRTKLVSWGWS